ncbi:glycosyl hydrolase family 8 [Gottfriedia sp. OAE603]|uniref:glycosyl hydrolase family 8 n=1 Tax=Gottfriedia sp. OAE603 TaxID=2663872 RepID=UPI00178965D5
MKKVFVILLISNFYIQASCSKQTYVSSNVTLATEKFISSNMVNKNGILATYLKDEASTNPTLAAGREALSESIGLQLTYLVQKNDRKTFETYYQSLNKYFISEETGIVYWKLEKDGTTNVTTNALVDDWRIADALFKAGEKWNIQKYITTAKNICNAINTYNKNNGYIVNFYDEQYKKSSDKVSIFFVDPTALNYMSKYNLIDSETYNLMNSLLKNTPNDGVFFSENYNVITKTYQNESRVNMIEQLYIAYFLKLAGKDSTSFYSFTKEQFIKNKMLFGQYDRATRRPLVKYESNAVYGMLILYALQMNDQKFAKSVYQRMRKFEITDKKSPYYGGYVIKTKSGYNTHIFDNLFPLLAKQELKTIY